MKMREFIEVPIAQLEMYGLNLQMIAKLEQHFGLYIKDLQHLRDEHILNVSSVGVTQLRNLKDALARLKRSDKLPEGYVGTGF